MVLVCTVVGLYIFLYGIENNKTYNIGEDKDDDQKETKKVWKLFRRLIIVGVLFMLLSILLPSKKTCMEMMIASQVTHENVENVKEEVYTIIDYIENYDHHADTTDSEE
jgi:multisubunit Na+/H+ antiporter MnhB subunit